MVNELKHSKAQEKFRSYLKEENHRITPERFEVLEAALDYTGHFGADDLFISMQMKKSNVSRATVYNTLELLDQCGVIAKRNFGDKKATYESTFNRKAHDHLICIDCGNIREFSTKKIERIVDEICDDLGYECTGYSFNIFGRCKKGHPVNTIKRTLNTTLDQAKSGDYISVLNLPDENTRIQLIRFGISEGDTIVCLERLPGGTIVLQRNRQEIALGGELAKKISVLIQQD